MKSASTAWHRRLVVRYTATLVAVAVGSAALVGVPLYSLASDLLERTLDERLEGVAEIAALILPDPTGAASLATLREEADLDAICVYGGDALALPPSDPGRCALDEIDARTLQIAAVSDAATTPVRVDAEGVPYVMAFAPVAEGHGAPQVIGVRASASYLERLRDLRALFGVAGAVWLGLVALVGRWGAGRLVRPIRGLLGEAERLGAEGAGGVDGDRGEPARGDAEEIQALYDAFQAMAVRVRSRETGLRALAGSVAHEVRNPSNALRLHLGLLRRELGPATPSVDARLQTFADQLDQLDATVDDFLLLTRDHALRREPVALRELLEEACPGVRVEAPDATVSVSRVLLGRAVANLVRNAVEAGGEPVAVTATVTDRLRIAVVDHGPGLPSALVSRAFEPFVTGRADGSGLGLAIVAAVARGHGGAARIERSGPDGTEVVIELPLR